MTCSGVSGSKLKLIGCYLIELNIHGKSLFHLFFIADSLPGLYSAILGKDFAKKHGLSYCSISNSTYFEKPEKLLSSAILSKDVHLPARSSTKVRLKMTFNELQTMMVSIRGCRQIFPSEYLLEPKDEFSVCYLTNSSYTH